MFQYVANVVDAQLKRRRAARELTLTRGSIEDARFQRLHDLKSSMNKLDELDEPIRQEVVKILKEADFKAGDSSVAVLDQVITEKTMVDVEPSAPVIAALLCANSRLDL